MPLSLAVGKEESEVSDSKVRPSWSGAVSSVPCIALRTASLIARRTSFSSEKRTSCLVGVDVNVHLPRVNLNAQCHRRVAPRGHGCSVSVVYALRQAIGPNPPTVYGDRLTQAAGLGDTRQRCVACNLEGSRLAIHPPHRPGLSHAVELGKTLDKVLGR